MCLTHKKIRLVCLLIIGGLLLTCIGVAYGRYCSIRQETLAFQAAQNDSSRAIEIHSADGWQITADRAEYTFSLDNADGVAEQRATLRLTATEGLDPTRVTVTLTVDDTVYSGTARAIEAGTPLYTQMGRGTEYRFYSDGEEVAWAVSDTPTYTLTVEGKADVSLLRLAVTEV